MREREGVESLSSALSSERHQCGGGGSIPSPRIPPTPNRLSRPTTPWCTRDNTISNAKAQIPWRPTLLPSFTPLPPLLRPLPPPPRLEGPSSLHPGRRGPPRPRQSVLLPRRTVTGSQTQKVRRKKEILHGPKGLVFYLGNECA